MLRFIFAGACVLCAYVSRFLQDGTVLEVRDSETCSGVWAENLFHWNSIMLRLDTGLHVEYVR